MFAYLVMYIDTGYICDKPIRTATKENIDYSIHYFFD